MSTIFASYIFSFASSLISVRLSIALTLSVSASLTLLFDFDILFLLLLLLLLFVYPNMLITSKPNKPPLPPLALPKRPREADLICGLAGGYTVVVEEEVGDSSESDEVDASDLLVLFTSCAGCNDATQVLSEVSGDAVECCGSVNEKEDEEGDDKRCYVVLLMMVVVVLFDGSVALSFMFYDFVCFYVVKSIMLSLLTATRESGEPARARLVQPKSASITECGVVLFTIVVAAVVAFCDGDGDDALMLIVFALESLISASS